MGAEFLNAWYPHAKNILVPNPTWGNHIPIMKNAGLSLEKYTYFDKSTNGLNIDGMLEDIHVSHVKCTGVDLTLLLESTQEHYCLAPRLCPQPYWC